MATTINAILNDIRLKAMTEREKGKNFERMMKLWFMPKVLYVNKREMLTLKD